MVNPNIRVCLKCREYIILHETHKDQIKLEDFNQGHFQHSLITTLYSEIDNLECGKVHCNDDDFREEMDLKT
jgi:hypothetical protein